jgi:hypothetical protein
VFGIEEGEEVEGLDTGRVFAGVEPIGDGGWGGVASEGDEGLVTALAGAIFGKNGEETFEALGLVKHL